MKKSKFLQKKVHLYLVLLVLLVSISTAYSGCGAVTGKSGGGLTIINYFSPAEVGGMTEITSGSMYLTVMHIVYDSLTHLTQEGTIKPDLAESIDISPDGKTITFKLRKGVKFHDGADFNAEAVKFQVDTMKWGRGTYWSNVESATVIDDYTIRIVLKKFNAEFLYQLARIYGMIGSPIAAKKPASAPLTEKLVGTGPFKLVDFKRDVHFKTTKFADYWQTGKPKLDSVTWKFINNTTTAALAFKAGEGDILWRAIPADAAELKKAGYPVIKYNYGLMYLVGDSANADSPFANMKVRQAIEHAIDKKAINDATGYGFPEVLTQVCPTNIKTGYVNNLPTRAYDPGKAKQLLAEAGYTNGFQTSLITTPTFDTGPIIAIQANLKAVGIDAKVDVVDDAKYRAIAKDGWKNGLLYRDTGIDADFMMAMARYYNAESIYMKSLLKPPTFLAGLNSALLEVDSQKRAKITQQINRQLYEEALVCPLWTFVSLYPMQKYVRDTGISETDQFAWRPADTWLDK